ncbi:hypothetical protein CDAR_183991 [Caerostris darwini]|uniref:Uncharacterized protein n=1 Tax=Caerostris darwini TaxID=1538125 RepID=A0AAV4TTM4_9ARAC|nr:hypothetical protein CDAR_183991 [Caerostris darwini]
MALVLGCEVDGRWDDMMESRDSVDLMKRRILRSKYKNSAAKAPEREGRCNLREEFTNLSEPNIEVKLMKQRCSSFGLQEQSSTEANSKEESQPPHIAASETVETPVWNHLSILNLNDTEENGPLEASGELSKADKEELFVGDGKDQPLAHVKDSLSELSNSSSSKLSSKNSLKLACRNLSGGIFEDCSTYNITVPEMSPDVQSYRGNEIFTNSIAGSYCGSMSAESAISDDSYAKSFSDSVAAEDSPDDQTSLGDTFFTHYTSGDQEKAPPNESHSSEVTRKSSTAENDARRSSQSSFRKNSQTPKAEVAKNNKEEVVNMEDSHGGKKISKRIRKRDRKSLSKSPFMYTCPKCNVSYEISSKKSSDGVCLHCDLWTSVEPEFLKKEKLTWNTCRIC